MEVQKFTSLCWDLMFNYHDFFYLLVNEILTKPNKGVYVIYEHITNHVSFPSKYYPRPKAMFCRCQQLHGLRLTSRMSDLTTAVHCGHCLSCGKRRKCLNVPSNYKYPLHTTNSVSMLVPYSLCFQQCVISYVCLRY